MARYSFVASDRTKYSFANEGQFAEFVRKEINDFQWLRPYQGHAIPNFFFNGIVEPLQAVQTLLANQAVDEQIKVHFQRYLDFEPTLHAKAATRAWVQNLVKTSPVQAIFALAYLANRIGKVGTFDWSMGNTSDWAIGIAKAYAFAENLQPAEAAKAHADSAAVSALDAASALSNARDAQASLEELAADAAAVEDVRKAQRSASDEALERAASEKLAEVTKTADDVIEKAEANWAAFQREISSQLALRAPSTYWKKKHVRHTRWVAGLGAVTTIVGVGGALVLQDIAWNVFGVLQFNKVPTWFQVVTFSVSALVYVLMLRTLLRLAMSHVHLALDSAERQTMIVSYLALARRGQVKDESLDKILASIFRPTGDGIVKDEGIPISILSELVRSK